MKAKVIKDEYRVLQDYIKNKVSVDYYTEKKKTFEKIIKGKDDFCMDVEMPSDSKSEVAWNEKYSFKLSTVINRSFDEEKLKDILKLNNLYCRCKKTVVDINKLEYLIKAGEINPEILEPAYIEKKTRRILVK